MEPWNKPEMDAKFMSQRKSELIISIDDNVELH
ncbi:Uncharacterised protein [Serratia entomophila]|nr:Uncharacterised protein [Serratia entomophila]CAI1810380.1 Uncharacterised protein [Serratia entomophila]